MEIGRLKYQVAVITGGADGLGKGIAKRLANEAANVVIFDANQTQLDQTIREFEYEKKTVSGEKVNITDEDAVKKALERVVQRHGRISIMVNSAGIVGTTSTKIADYDTNEFDRVYQVNLRGSFLMTKYSLPYMLQKNYGRILLIASIAGKEGNPGMVGYSASKAGVIGLVKSAGKEYAETGITINGLAPAVIHTALVDACTPEQVKYMTDRIPMKRTGKIEEVASLAAWIVSPECSFTTGFTFDLSGGRATY